MTLVCTQTHNYWEPLASSFLFLADYMCFFFPPVKILNRMHPDQMGHIWPSGIHIINSNGKHFEEIWYKGEGDRR